MKRHSGFLRVYTALEAVGGGGVAKLEKTIYFAFSPLFYPLVLLQLLLARSSHIKSRTKAVTHSNIQRLKIS